MLVPMNLITGLFGMNVRIPWGGKDTLAPFFGIVGVIVATVGCAIIYARRARML